MAGLNQAQPDCLIAYPSALHVLSFEARGGPATDRAAAGPELPPSRCCPRSAPPPSMPGACASETCGAPRRAAAPRSPCDQAAHAPERGPGDRRASRRATAGRWRRASASAKVYLTNLYNRVLPLIRYEITDEVTVLTEPARAGRRMPCVADIQGRLDDTFVYDDRRVHPHVFRSALGRHAGDRRVPGPPDRGGSRHRGAVRGTGRLRGSRARDRTGADAAGARTPEGHADSRRAARASRRSGQAAALRTPSGVGHARSPRRLNPVAAPLEPGRRAA